MKQLMLIGLLGAAGSLLRYGVAIGADWAASACGLPAFRYGTLLLNVTGSLAIGFLYVALPSAGLSVEARIAIAVGLLGGFTTFSAFAFDTTLALRQHEYGLAVANILLNNLLSICAVWTGWRLAEKLFAAA